ncbi:MAG TPA: hypothetical protein VKR79_01205 [Gaiellaceae bacterium]|nr:hypothetical protein [Gaiellaceae bacterium]
MRATALVLVLGALLLAGCGGGGGGNTAPTTTSNSNAEASKPATQILADAVKAAKGASSVHLSGSIVSSGSPITLDFAASKQAATGKMTTDGLEFNFIRIGSEIYIQGSDAFWKHFGGTAAAQLFHGKWLKGPAGKGQFATFGSLTSPTAFFTQLTSSTGTPVNQGLTTYKGQSVIAIHDSKKKGTLYIAATGTPYPVALVGGGKNSGSISFSGWNASVSTSAPKGAIDISALTSG